MSDPVTISLIAAIATATPLIFAQVVSLIISLNRAKRIKEQLLATNKMTNDKLDHITVLTNSTLTAANKRIADLEKQVKFLLGEDET